ncbi:type II secretion system F family protein [Micromonospora sp. NPDC049366]|uniref:type II secretion system F family protein n=1 Tax=Micromonospora sp. NPDC049366 TaxID=3364271 RepID=UPI0037968923
MTTGIWLSAASLLGAAVLIGWPLRAARVRRRVTVGSGGSPAASTDDALIEWVLGLGRAPGGPAGPRSELLGGRTEAATTAHRSAFDGASVSRASVSRASASDSVVEAVARDVSAGRDVGSRSSWPGAPAGGPTQPSRPAGPTRPPRRRDRRGPAGLGGTPFGRVTVQRQRNEARPASSDRPRWSVRLSRSPRRMLVLAALGCAGIGGLVAGPVGAAALGGYGALGVRAALRWRASRHTERIRRHRLDELCGLAADLRAGLPAPVPANESSAEPPEGTDRLDRLVSAAVRLADRTGAPLAELVERIEADARSTARGMAAATAQAAGARATAWLLAALPLGGIALGYGIGVDPLAVLLHTPVGAVCAVLTLVLQAAGLFWTERLTAAPGRGA